MRMRLQQARKFLGIKAAQLMVISLGDGES